MIITMHNNNEFVGFSSRTGARLQHRDAFARAISHAPSKVDVASKVEVGDNFGSVIHFTGGNAVPGGGAPYNLHPKP